MTIGTHVIGLSKFPLNLNPYMTYGVYGWQAGPGEDPIGWVSAPGKVSQARGGGVFPYAAGPPVPRVAGDVTYRVRVVMTKGLGGPVTVGIHVGDSAAAVAAGPGGAPGHALAMSHTFPDVAEHATVTLEHDFDVPASFGPSMPYIGPWLTSTYEPTATAETLQTVDSIELIHTPEHVDLSCLVDDVSVVHGRSDAGSQPDPSSATLNITIGPGALLPQGTDIGAALTVDTVIAGVPHRRFAGRVTDIDIGWDDAGQGTPAAGVGRIVAVSNLSIYARRLIGGDTIFPQELESARVRRAFENAGLTITEVDPGIAPVIGLELGKYWPALTVARAAADSAGGLVWETKEGEIRYADADHRSAVTPALELDACDVLVTPTWNRTVAGLVNEVSLTSGKVEGEDSSPLTLTNQASIDRWGRYGYAVSTDLVPVADAWGVAARILAANGEPVWMLNALPVDMAGLDDAQTATVLTLDVHSLIGVSGFPDTGTTPTDAQVWVEGWTERLAWGIHELELTVSGYERTVAPAADVVAAVAQGTDTKVPA